MFLKNRNISSKIKRSKVTDYAALIFKRQAKVLIRLCICAGWSESLLVAHTTVLKFVCHGSNIDYCRKKICLLIINIYISGESKEVWILISWLQLNPNSTRRNMGNVQDLCGIRIGSTEVGSLPRRHSKNPSM